MFTQMGQNGTGNVNISGVGDVIVTKIQGWKQPYRGTLADCDAQRKMCKMKFDDGEMVNKMMEIEEIKSDDISDAGTNEGDPEVGARVSAKVAGWKKPYEGVVKAINSDGSFCVLFDDGEKIGDVQPDEILTVLISAGSPSSKIVVGARVLGKLIGWKQACEGTVEDVTSKGFRVLFDDGEEQILTQQQIELLESPKLGLSKPVSSDIAVGVHVLGRLDGWKQSYPGKVQEITKKGFRVLFDDGEEQVLTQQQIELLESPKLASSKPVSSDIAVGVHVLGRLDGWKQSYPGKVQEVTSKGFRVLFDDGEEQVLTQQQIELLESPTLASSKPVSSDIAVGVHVLGRLDGWKQSYPGKVQEITNKGFRVLFDDGEEQVLTQQQIELLESPTLASSEPVLSDIVVGIHVLGRLDGWKQSYPGKVQEVTSKGFRILFDDGEEQVLTQQQIELLESPTLASSKPVSSDIAVGVHVLGRLDGWKQSYSGKVQEITNNGFRIRFDDGEEQVLTQQQIELLESPTLASSKPVSSDIAVGVHVLGRLDGWKQSYPGKVQEVTSKGFRILFDDGEEQVLTEQQIELTDLPKAASQDTAPQIAVGTRVLGRLQGWKQAYPGQVKEITSKGFTVVFDDNEVATLSRVQIIQVLDSVASPRNNSPRTGTSGSPRSHLGNDDDLLAFLNDEQDMLSNKLVDTPEEQLVEKFLDAPAETSASEAATRFAVDAASTAASVPTALSKEEISVGDIVTARLPQWQQAYQGVVKRFNSQDCSYKIEFEDGQKVNSVSLAAIVSLVESKKKVAASKVFTAPDGKKFQDRAQYKKYVNEVYSFMGKTGDHKSLVKTPGCIDGQPFSLHTLTDCIVRLLCWSTQVQADLLRDSKIFIGPTESSVFIRDCHNCEFTVACRQLRVRDCRGCTFNLFSNVDPVIETSTDLTFKPFNGAYPGLRKHFKRAKLDVNDNHWRLIFDFNVGGCDGFGIPDPHYELIEAKNGKLSNEWIEDGVNGPGPCENPVPPDAVATTVSDGGGTHQGSSHKVSSSTKQQADAVGVGAPGNDMNFAWATAETLYQGAVARVNFNRKSEKPLNSDFYQGVVTKINADGTFAIKYDDGDVESDCKLQFIKVGSKNKLTSSAAAQPETTEPEATKPEVTKPEATKPEATIPVSDEQQVSQEVVFEWANKAGMPNVDQGMEVLVNFDREPPNLNFSPSEFYKGVVAAVNMDGTFDVKYDNGDEELQVELTWIKLKTSAKALSSRVFNKASTVENTLVDSQKEVDCPPSPPPLPALVPKPSIKMAPVTLKSKKVQVEHATNKQPIHPSLSKAQPCSLKCTALSFFEAKSPSEVPIGAVVLVNRDPSVHPSSWTDLTKGVVQEKNVDGTFAVLFDGGEMDELCHYGQIQVGVEVSSATKCIVNTRELPNKVTGKVRAEVKQLKEQEAAKTNLLTRKLDALKSELRAIRESQRHDQKRMRMERKAQEERILNENRRKIQAKSATQLEIKQMLLVDALRKEIMDQREMHSRLMSDHQTAMDKLNMKMIKLSSSNGSPTSANCDSSKLHTGVRLSPAKFSEMGAHYSELENVRNEIQVTRAALEADRRNAFAHSKRMQELTKNKKLERGWNSTMGQKTKKEKQSLPQPDTSKQQSAADAELLQQALHELAKTKRERTQVLLSARKNKKKQSSPSVKAKQKQIQEKIRIAVRYVTQLYEAYESRKTQSLVAAPKSAVICTAEWAQRVSELRLKPLPFRSRAHDDDEWRKVGQALCDLEPEAVVDINRSVLYKEWLEWTISSNRELVNISVSPALAKRLEMLGDDDIDTANKKDVVLSGLLFTHRQCERRMLKPRSQQNAAFARAHFVLDPPLPIQAKLRNALYKKICSDEWASFRAAQKQHQNNKDAAVSKALVLLSKLGTEDELAKKKLLASQIQARKIEAANDFSHWKAIKDKTLIKSHIVSGIRSSDSAKRTPYPRPAGAPTDSTAALSADRPVPLRYIGSGRLSEPESNYIRAAGRTSVPESSIVAHALNTKAADAGLVHGAAATVHVVKSQNQHDPWSNVEATKNKLDSLQGRAEEEARLAVEREEQAQQGFLEWEDAVKREKEAMKLLRQVDFVERCLFNKHDGDAGALASLECFFKSGDLCSWKLIGKALHSTHHSMSRSNTLFSAWADWTASNVLSCLSKLLFMPTTCLITADCEDDFAILSTLTGKQPEEELCTSFPQGALVLICVEVFGPSGKLSAEKMAGLLDSKAAVLAVVNAHRLGRDTNTNFGDKVTLRGGKELACFLSDNTNQLPSSSLKNCSGGVAAKCFAYLVPQLLAKALFTSPPVGLSNNISDASLSVSTTSLCSNFSINHLLLHRLRDKQHVSSRVRVLCADQWNRFFTPVRWFMDSLDFDEELIIAEELAVVRRLYASERLRARVVGKNNSTKSCQISEAIKKEASRFWMAAVYNPALECSSVLFQADMKGTACMAPPLDNTGRATGSEWVSCSLRVGDCVCLVESNTDSISRFATVSSRNSESWFNGRNWKIVEEINAVRHSLVLASFPTIKSVGNGALVYRIVMDKEAAPQKHEQGEVVHISVLTGALVTRFELDNNNDENSKEQLRAYTMFHLPDSSCSFTELEHEFAAWSHADFLKQKQRTSHNQAVARKHVREHTVGIQQTAYKRVQRLLHHPPSSARQATAAFDKVGSVLFRLDRLNYNESVLLVEKDEEKDNVHQQNDGKLLPEHWRELWMNWVQKSDKWQEFEELGFTRDDMLSLIEKKWIVLSNRRAGYQSYKSKRDISNQSELLIRELRDILRAT